MRQTCHEVNDLIESDRNISVHIGGYYFIELKEPFCQLHYRNVTRRTEDHVDPAGHYGTRLGTIELLYSDSEGDGKFEQLCEFLTRCQITSE